jgi:hypothetical protein
VVSFVAVAQYGTIWPVDDVEMYLATLGTPVDPSEARRFWNAKESPKLDILIRAALKVRHGTAYTSCWEDDWLCGPAGRVPSLLFLRGTIPDYRVPVLDKRLETEIISVMIPCPEDSPFVAVQVGAVARFLADHRGYPVVVEELPWVI